MLTAARSAAIGAVLSIPGDGCQNGPGLHRLRVDIFAFGVSDSQARKVRRYVDINHVAVDALPRVAGKRHDASWLVHQLHVR